MAFYFTFPSRKLKNFQVEYKRALILNHIPYNNMQQILMLMSSFTCSLVGALGQNLRSPKAWGPGPRSHLLFPVKAVKFFTDQ